jgi:hypothetical protein
MLELLQMEGKREDEIRRNWRKEMEWKDEREGKEGEGRREDS